MMTVTLKNVSEAKAERTMAAASFNATANRANKTGAQTASAKHAAQTGDSGTALAAQ